MVILVPNLVSQRWGKKGYMRIGARDWRAVAVSQGMSRIASRSQKLDQSRILSPYTLKESGLCQ